MIDIEAQGTTQSRVKAIQCMKRAHTELHNILYVSVRKGNEELVKQELLKIQTLLVQAIASY